MTINKGQISRHIFFIFGKNQSDSIHEINIINNSVIADDTRVTEISRATQGAGGGRVDAQSALPDTHGRDE